MKVFLTGSSGFIGSFLLRNLLNSIGYEVAILLRNPKDAWRIQNLLPKVKVITGDLNNLNSIESELLSFRPDIFVHLAWNGVFGGNRNDHLQWRNVNSTLELVELAHKLNVKTWIGLGSQAEYGVCQNKTNELCATHPTTMYGASKLATQILSEKLCEQFGIRYAWLRLFSSYGPTDNPQWLIPYTINKLLKNESPSFTPAEQLWDYIHVKDVASAISSVAFHDNAQGIFNLGSGNAVPLRSIIEKIRDITNPSATLNFGAVTYRPDQVMHLEADISKLFGATGWRPSISLDDGLYETVNWWRSQA
jgi:nucleoside-diphosphate-sugar epimerase